MFGELQGCNETYELWQQGQHTRWPTAGRGRDQKAPKPHSEWDVGQSQYTYDDLHVLRRNSFAVAVEARWWKVRGNVLNLNPGCSKKAYTWKKSERRTRVTVSVVGAGTTGLRAARTRKQSVCTLSTPSSDRSEKWRLLVLGSQSHKPSARMSDGWGGWAEWLSVTDSLLAVSGCCRNIRIFPHFWNRWNVNIM